MGKPVVKELPGLHGPVFSIYQDGDWWRDKAHKRRAWSTRHAAERAMAMSGIMRSLKMQGDKMRTSTKPKPKPKPRATKTISQLIAEYEAAHPNATAWECADHLGIPVERVFDRREP